MLGSGFFLKIAKINSQQQKPICPNHKNWFPQNTKNRQSAKISCNTVYSWYVGKCPGHPFLNFLDLPRKHSLEKLKS